MTYTSYTFATLAHMIRKTTTTNNKTIIRHVHNIVATLVAPPPAAGGAVSSESRGKCSGLFYLSQAKTYTSKYGAYSCGNSLADTEASIDPLSFEARAAINSLYGAFTKAKYDQLASGGGTEQDADGSWYKPSRIGKEMLQAACTINTMAQAMKNLRSRGDDGGAKKLSPGAAFLTSRYIVNFGLARYGAVFNGDTPTGMETLEWDAALPFEPTAATGATRQLGSTDGGATDQAKFSGYVLGGSLAYPSYVSKEPVFTFGFGKDSYWPKNNAPTTRPAGGWGSADIYPPGFYDSLPLLRRAVLALTEARPRDMVRPCGARAAALVACACGRASVRAWCGVRLGVWRRVAHGGHAQREPHACIIDLRVA